MLINRIALIRKSLGLTQQQLASRSILPLATIQGYEQGRREPLVSGAIKIAKSLGVTVEELFQTIEANCRPQP